MPPRKRQTTRRTSKASKKTARAPTTKSKVQAKARAKAAATKRKTTAKKRQTKKKPATKKKTKSGRTYKAAKIAGRNLKVSKSSVTRASLQDALKQELAGKRRPYLLRKADELISNVENGRGAKTRGWALNEPHKGAERTQLFKTCGQECFLAEPESVSNKGVVNVGFPICRRCVGKNCDCHIDPQGLQSAYNRARQWGHQNIADNARRIMKKNGL